MSVRIEGLGRVNRRLQRIARRELPQRFLYVHRETCKHVLQDVVINTPRDRAVHINGWNVGVNQPAPIVKDPPPAPTGAATIRRGFQLLRSMPPFSRTEVANGVRAINILDKGGFVPPNPGPSRDPRPGRKGRVLVINGYSRQAPQGMTRVALRNANRNLPGLVRQARRLVI